MIIKTLSDELRSRGFPDAMIARATVNGKPLAEAEPAKTKRSDGWPGFKSKGEALYAMELETMQANGEILEWMYEPFVLRLTEATIVEGKRKRAIAYKPDFVLWLPDGRMRCVEIKGYRNTDDINRFKVAKDKFRRWEFVMLARDGGSWRRIF